jgi:hypothetical protein
MIEMGFSSIENLNISLRIHKVNDIKNIFSLSYKEGNKITFLKMMKDFCDDTGKYFQLF